MAARSPDLNSIENVWVSWIALCMVDVLSSTQYFSCVRQLRGLVKWSLRHTNESWYSLYLEDLWECLRNRVVVLDFRYIFIVRCDSIVNQ